MPRIKYIGYPSPHLGKHLLWILSNLKDFGVGRVVTRSMFERYPEPSYFVIKKVVPYMDDANKYGRVWADCIFRGRRLRGDGHVPSPHLPDYRLVPKSEEHRYLDHPVDESKPMVLPRYRRFPPLLRKMVIRDMKAKGLDTSAEPMLPAVYANPTSESYRIAEEGEEPDVSFTEEKRFIVEKFRAGVRDI
ncbi:unnamed protein product [Ixodes pacificus]